MSNVFYRIKKALGMLNHYYVRPDVGKFGSFGEKSTFSRPADIKCAKNIYIGKTRKICPNRVIFIVEKNAV